MSVDYIGKNQPDGTCLGYDADDLIAFHGATPCDQSDAPTAELTALTSNGSSSADYAIQALTNSTPYGFKTADEGETVLEVIINLQTIVGEIVDCLQEKGLMASS